jgi:hypothetical protein
MRFSGMPHLARYNDLVLRFTRLCFLPLALVLVAGLRTRRAASASKPLGLVPKWTVNLKHLGSRPSHKGYGYLGIPYDPGSVLHVACGQSLVGVAIDGNVVFFNIETGNVTRTKNLTPGSSLGFAPIFPVDHGRFLVDLHRFAGTREELFLLDSSGVIVNSLDLSSPYGGGPWAGVTVSTTANSFLLYRYASGQTQVQLRDSSTFAVRQSWGAQGSALFWQAMSDNTLLAIENYPQPLGAGNRAGKEEPILIASPGGQPHQLGKILAGHARVLTDDRILAVHVNELRADLVDLSGTILRTYDTPFSAGHLYFDLAAIAPDGRYFAAHFLGQKNFFLPGREYLYIWALNESEPIASVQFKWNRYYESESAFCSDDRRLAVVENAKLEMFALPPAGHL